MSESISRTHELTHGTVVNEQVVFSTQTLWPQDNQSPLSLGRGVGTVFTQQEQQQQQGAVLGQFHETGEDL